MGLDTRSVTQKALHMLTSAESDAESQGFSVDSLVGEHIQVNNAPKTWCRTHKAPEWVNQRVAPEVQEAGGCWIKP